MFRKKSKIKKVLKEDKKFKESEEYQKIMKKQLILERDFFKEAKKCKHNNLRGCQHKKHKKGKCKIEMCPL